MIYPKIPLAQALLDSCLQKGVRHIVISPGSRNAPLTIGFSNNPEFQCYSIVDERCAAFFALGIAKELQQPVAVVCTSGSAVLNYYPAVAEAFYSQISLIVLSADRPESKIDIGDGQTIRQRNVFENHSVFNANLSEIASQENDDLISQALDSAIVMKGPVHINIPFEEPLYETTERQTYFPKLKKCNNEEIPFSITDEQLKIWNTTQKKMLLVGELPPNAIENQLIEQLANDPSIIVLTEKTSNLHHQAFIDKIDVLITPFTEIQFQNLQPDLVLTFGGMVVSKRIKSFLRKYPPKHHWHVDTLRAYDTYNALSFHYKTTITTFLKTFLNTDIQASNYQNDWLEIKKCRAIKQNVFTQNIAFSDYKVMAFLSKNIPQNTNLQISNSAAIRYVQLFDFHESIVFGCNRGTSGIDGSTSTAIGVATASQKQTIFITGDISFFYDSNALWNKYIPKNFKIIVLNNNGGGIFRILPGHQENETFHNFFETQHQLNASHLAKMFDFQYFDANNETELIEKYPEFINENIPAIFEIFTPTQENSTILLNFFKNLKN